MKSKKIPLTYLLITNIIISFYHVLIMLQLIDYKMVWGGKLHSKSEMFQFESISLFVNSIILVILLIDFKRNINRKWIKIVYWILAILFTLNTLGNSLSINFYEKLIFAPITFISSISCLMLISHKRKLTNQN